MQAGTFIPLLDETPPGESASRILAAADRERRRLERDLHDGAQQRLVSISMCLRVLGTWLAPGSEAERLLATAQDELAASLQELRELARGLHPAVLQRTRACRRARGAGAACAAPGRAERRAGRAPSRGRRGGRVLPRLRGARQHREVRGRRRCDRPGRPARRRARRRGRRRRSRRRRPGRRLGPARARRSRRGAERPAPRLQRSGDRNHGAGRDPAAARPRGGLARPRIAT